MWGRAGRCKLQMWWGDEPFEGPITLARQDANLSPWRLEPARPESQWLLDKRLPFIQSASAQHIPRPTSTPAGPVNQPTSTPRQPRPTSTPNRPLDTPTPAGPVQDPNLWEVVPLGSDLYSTMYGPFSTRGGDHARVIMTERGVVAAQSTLFGITLQERQGRILSVATQPCYDAAGNFGGSIHFVLRHSDGLEGWQFGDANGVLNNPESSAAGIGDWFPVPDPIIHFPFWLLPGSNGFDCWVCDRTVDLAIALPAGVGCGTLLVEMGVLTAGTALDIVATACGAILAGSFEDATMARPIVCGGYCS